MTSTDPKPPAEASDLRRPKSEAQVRLERIVRQPGCKWFCSTARRAEEWNGPFDTIDAAVASTVAEDFECHAIEGHPIYVGQGSKLNKRERDDMCVDYHWEVEALEAFEIRLPRLSNT